MKNLIILFSVLLAVGCSRFEDQELHGHWKNNNWEFIFNPDNSCAIAGQGGTPVENLKYTTFGNTLEIIENGKVILSGLTILSVTEDELKVQFRNLVGSGDNMDNTQLLLRVKD